MAEIAATAKKSWIDLTATPDFDLGALRVFPPRRKLCLGEECRDLEPRVMKVLVALAAARPEVLSRDRLIELCWEGRIVSDDALNRCILALRNIARDFGEAGYVIETVPRIGYRLVEMGATQNSGEAGHAQAMPAAEPRRRRLALVALLGLLALMLAGLVAYRKPWSVTQGPASIAVLPFRNLAPGDPYFAEGMSEEILARLARDPGFKVAGRTSSSMFRGAADLREVAKKLDVEYVLEGSVRAQDRRVRVDAALVRAGDGKRLWTKSFDGTLDDTFAIQDEIGNSVARALALRLARPKQAATPPPPDSEAYNLYLTARGLIRTRNRDYSQAAIELLTQAVRYDPKFAPAWARLSEATRMASEAQSREVAIRMRPLVETQARRAIAIDPNSAEGHAALGVLLGYSGPEARQHLLRAAELDPNNAETQVWLGVSHKGAGEFGQELAAYRRAYAIDPLWFRTSRDLAIALADLGRRAEAEAVTKESHHVYQLEVNSLMARVAWSFGDYSEAIRLWTAAAEAQGPDARASRRRAEIALYFAGLTPRPPFESAGRRVPRAAADTGRGVIIGWLPGIPSPAEWHDRNRDAVSAQLWHLENHFGVKLMLDAGQAGPLLKTYDSPAGLLGIKPGQPLRIDQLWDAPVVALALRSGGRGGEADRMLTEAGALVDAVKRRGEVPFWFDACAGTVWAVAGKKDKALDALDRAWGRGWRGINLTGSRDFTDDPVFRNLRGEPRFEKLRANLAEHNRRERDEIARLHT